MKHHDNDRLMTRQDVEERFGVTKRYLELATMRGEGPRVVRVGRLVRYRVKDIHAWIEACSAKKAR
jgi:predicted DNA-binding transcriptional regulator AlpA